MQSHPADSIFVFTAVILILGVYALPSFVAFYRDHPNRWIVLVINIAFGGTIIGWGIALAWAFHATHRSKGGSAGGESGLNLFINDTKKVELVSTPNSQLSLADELQRLHALRQQGAITTVEFERFKAKLI